MDIPTLTNLEGAECLVGARVCYYETLSGRTPLRRCDHEGQHNAWWREALSANERRLEVGTVTAACSECTTREHTLCLEVKWDCGVVQHYCSGRLDSLKAYDLAPTGFRKLNLVWCDVCLLPVMGFAFRLASDSVDTGRPTTADKLYDLCCLCYNSCQDKQYTRHEFRRNLPCEAIEDNTREKLSPRSSSECYQLVGVFPGAVVAYGNGLTGKVVKTVHEKGKTDMRKAKHWRCCAEIDPKVDTKGPKQTSLDCCELSCHTLKAIEPTVGDSIYASHFPAIGPSLVEEFTRHQDVNLEDGPECFQRMKNPVDGPEFCWSFTVTSTQLPEIKDERIWDKCLKKLEICNLHMNNLVDLPRGLEDFKDSLQLLSVQSNNFQDIPAIVFRFNKLMYLSMHDNSISCIPAKISKLSNLTHLYMGENNLRSLPDVFGDMPELLKVSLKGNQLTRLPDSFTTLQKLQVIDLSHNHFQDVPSQLLELNLLSVDLEYNSLQRFAPECDPEKTLSFLSKLSFLSLIGNPLQLQSLLSTQPAALLEAISDPKILQELNDSHLRKSLRILLVGNCGAGKTSVAEALGFEKYVTPANAGDHDHTIGINRYTVPIQVGGVTIELIIWDFAGEDSSVPMNNIFLTNATVVLVVVDMKSYVCTPEGFKAHVSNWVRPIMMQNRKPVIWIVPTHTDKCDDADNSTKERHLESEMRKECVKLEKCVRMKINDYEDQIERQSENEYKVLLKRKLEKVKELDEHNVPNFVSDEMKVLPLTNTYGLKGVSNLKEALNKLLQKGGVFVSFLEAPLDLQWLKAADCLREEAEKRLTASKAPIVSNTEALKLLNTTDDSELVRYLQHKGDVLRLPNDSFLLDAKWLIHILQCVFRHNFDEFIRHKIKMRQLQPELFNADEILAEKSASGVVPKQLLMKLWSEYGIVNDELLFVIGDLLQEFGLACKSGDGYMFPWLLMSEASDCSELDVRHSLITIEYIFSFCMPRSYFENFSVQCRKHVDKFDRTQQGVFEASCNNICIQVHHCSSQGDYEKIIICGFRNAQSSTDIERSAAQETSGMDDVWDVVMDIVGELEQFLFQSPWYDHPVRKVLCPGCVRVTKDMATVSRYDFEYSDKTVSGDLTNQRERSSSIRCTKCKQECPAKELVPPDNKKVDTPPIRRQSKHPEPCTENNSESPYAQFHSLTNKASVFVSSTCHLPKEVEPVQEGVLPNIVKSFNTCN